MQSRTEALILYAGAAGAGVIACIFALGLQDGVAPVVWTMLCGVLLGFVAPKGAWRWVLFLSIWIPAVAILHPPFGTPAWCAPQRPPSLGAAVWVLLLIPVVAVYAGVLADWAVGRALSAFHLASLPWRDRVRTFLRGGAVAAAGLVVSGCLFELAQPLQPYGIGDTYCWDEFCFRVTSVERVKTIGSGAARVTAAGTFYVVHANLESPWWGRFPWSSDAVYVTDYSGTDYRYSAAGQRASDGHSGANRSQCHEILGASERETIVFDLPLDVVQPRLLVRDTLGLEGLLGGLRRNFFWYVKPAFNLRYD